MRREIKIQSICVFCGASNDANPRLMDLACEFGMGLASRKIRLVYGGGDVGMMGKLANSALDYGGEVVGVIPEHLTKRELAHQKIHTLHVVDSMHERKQLMFDLSDAFVCLPGGFGTLDEFMEIVTWKVLGLHSKPIILANLEHFFDHLISFVSHANLNGFLHASDGELYHVLDTVQEVFDYLELFRKK